MSKSRATGADVAILQAGAIRADRYIGPGEITAGDVNDMLVRTCFVFRPCQIELTLYILAYIALYLLFWNLHFSQKMVRTRHLCHLITFAFT